MNTVVQARLDSETRKLLTSLTSEMGLTQSDVLREGIRLLAASVPAVRRRRIVGIGKYETGITDLGSNKKHLKDFGR